MRWRGKKALRNLPDMSADKRDEATTGMPERSKSAAKNNIVEIPRESEGTIGGEGGRGRFFRVIRGGMQSERQQLPPLFSFIRQIRDNEKEGNERTRKVRRDYSRDNVSEMCEKLLSAVP